MAASPSHTPPAAVATTDTRHTSQPLTAMCTPCPQDSATSLDITGGHFVPTLNAAGRRRMGRASDVCAGHVVLLAHARRLVPARSHPGAYDLPCIVFFMKSGQTSGLSFLDSACRSGFAARCADALVPTWCWQVAMCASVRWTVSSYMPIEHWVVMPGPQQFLLQ